MAQLIVRSLDDDIVRRLKVRAAENGRSAEAEHREILRRALAPAVTEDFWSYAERMRLATTGRPRTDSALLLRRTDEPRP